MLTRRFRCRECKYVFDAHFGTGIRELPWLYQEIVTSIRKGVYGTEWKQLFKTRPGIAVNVGRDIYVCPHCRHFEEKFDLCLYEPMIFPGDPEAAQKLKAAAERKFVPPAPDLDQDYRKIRTYEHRCPKCRSVMRRYGEGYRLRCPQCRKEWLHMTSRTQV